MSDESGAAEPAGPPADAGTDGDVDAEVDEPPAPGLSDDGILLFFVALGCLLAASTAYTTGQSLAIVVFAVLAGAPAAVAFLADVVSEFVPGTRLELMVGGAALVGAAAAVPGRHYVNIATLVVAAALVGWRVVDVEVRGAER